MKRVVVSTTVRTDQREHITFLALAISGVVWMWLHTHPVWIGWETRWLFSWQDEFTTRALAGSVLRAFGEVTEARIDAVALIVALVVVLVVSAGLAKLAGRDPARLFLAVILVVSPVGWSAIAANKGRLDHLVMVFGIAAALTVRWPAAAAGLLAAAVLVHEAAIVLVVPWVAVWGFIHGRRWIAGPAVLAAGVMMLVRPGEATITASVPFLPGVVETVTWGVSENLSYALGSIASLHGVAWMAGSVIAVAPLLACCWVMLRGVELTRREWWLFAAASAPVGLSLVAVDYGRWFLFTSFWVVASALVVLRRVEKPLTREMVLAGLVVVAAGFLSGPVMARGYQWLVG